VEGRHTAGHDDIGGGEGERGAACAPSTGFAGSPPPLRGGGAADCVFGVSFYNSFSASSLNPSGTERGRSSATVP
jgi:hypothetical protein